MEESWRFQIKKIKSSGKKVDAAPGRNGACDCKLWDVNRLSGSVKEEYECI